ncbi:unnamed protein product [Schistocephalus solidus]|uniref:Reverse transcriptase domain-containing protein n=1 Tax=Schistocephalus solidus TaxID=70667 RepID=A0A183T2B4_SCHSO|nr:unnamed protein product [Schistocephalus solidus]
MALHGILPKTISTVKAYSGSTTARLFVYNNLSQPLDIRAGFILSPILFNYPNDRILGKARHEEDGVGLASGRQVTHLDYANDIARIASRKCLWTQPGNSMTTTIRVYCASVWSVLLYGCECCVGRVEDKCKLEVFDHRCMRTTILPVKYTHLVSKETDRTRCVNLVRISQIIQRRRLTWFGHVLRHPSYCPRSGTATQLEAPQGDLAQTWLDAVRQDMEVVLGPSAIGHRRWLREWIELSRSAAADLYAWRAQSVTSPRLA